MPTAREPHTSSLAEIARAFLKLGLISFGGPVAHLSYFHEEFVVRRQWVDEAAFADLLALCQFLPGPASSQVVFALGMRRAGLAGALVASFCFTLPSAVLMIMGGYGVAAMGDLKHAGWLHGLKLAAVGVVAQAVWSMGRTLCPDRARVVLALAAAALVFFLGGSMAQLGAILLGGAFGWLLYRGAMPAGEGGPVARQRHGLAVLALGLYGALLFLLPLAAAATGNRSLELFERFYRAGALVFGGGHVVLPLLQAVLVPSGWIGNDAFLAGYGMAQAVPGPLFTFAGYLGTVIAPGGHRWATGLLCLLAIFLPAWLLVGGALPFWERLRRLGWMQAALRGANAAVVGILFAALCSPVISQAIHAPRDALFAIAALVALERFKVPAWLVVLAAAGGGFFLL